MSQERWAAKEQKAGIYQYKKQIMGESIYSSSSLLELELEPEVAVNRDSSVSNVLSKVTVSRVLSPRMLSRPSILFFSAVKIAGGEVLGCDVLEDVSDLEGAEWEDLNNKFDLKVADLSWPVLGVGLELLAEFLDKTRVSEIGIIENILNFVSL